MATAVGTWSEFKPQMSKYVIQYFNQKKAIRLQGIAFYVYTKHRH